MLDAKDTRWGNCRDFVVDSSYAYELTDSGYLRIWSLHNYEVEELIQLPADKRFSSIGKDWKGEVYLGGWDTGMVFKLDRKRLVVKPFVKSKYYPISHIVFSRQGKIFLTVNSALYNPFSGKYWLDFYNKEGSRTHLIRKGFGIPNPFLKKWKFKKWTGFGRFEYMSLRYFKIPENVVVTTQDLLVMTATGGEWDGHYYFFDLRKEKILDPTSRDTLLRLFEPNYLLSDDKGNAYIVGSKKFDNSPVSGVFKIKPNRQVISYKSPIIVPPQDTSGGKPFQIYIENRYNVSWSGVSFNSLDSRIYYCDYRRCNTVGICDFIISSISLESDTVLGQPDTVISGLNTPVRKMAFPDSKQIVFGLGPKYDKHSTLAVWDGVRLRYLNQQK